MRPTKYLMEEHRAIERLLRVLATVSKNLQNGGNANIDSLEKAIDFIRTFADRCHHAKEEDVLFRFIGLRGLPFHEGPIGVMLMEHDEGREYVKNMADAVEGMKSGRQDSATKYAENAINFANLLSQHIQKEEGVLYAMADHLMGPGDEDSLMEQFRSSEAKKAGEGVHEKYLRILSELEKEFA